MGVILKINLKTLPTDLQGLPDRIIQNVTTLKNHPKIMRKSMRDMRVWCKKFLENNVGYWL